MNVFVTRRIPASGVDSLKSAGLRVTLRDEDSPIPRPELLERLTGHDALIAMLTERVDAELLDRHPQLRIVANFAVGFNNVDVALATSRRVAVTNTPDVLTDATADVAWALLLAAARRVTESENFLRSGRWHGWGPLQFLGAPIARKTLGIVGPGRIGAATARRARGFDMRVLYHGRRPAPAFEKETGAEYRALDDLLRESDFVSLHCPLTPETRHLIGPSQLQLMKRTAVLINTARGPVVDEAALVDALRARTIMAAGLDVFEEEPKIHPGLLELQNAVLLPHIGSANTETRECMSRLCAENIIAYSQGKKPPTILNPELLAPPR